MAIEDAAALGILFNKKYFNGDIAQSLAVYEEVRLPRVTRVQAAAAKAAYNINERIGRLVPLAMEYESSSNLTQGSPSIRTFRPTKSKTRRKCLQLRK